MKYKIKKRFKDKYTKALYEVGALIEFDDARAAEIAKSLGPDFFEKSEAPKAPKAPKAGGEGGSGAEGNVAETGKSGALPGED
jgi:hypothetical protein